MAVPVVNGTMVYAAQCLLVHYYATATSGTGTTTGTGATTTTWSNWWVPDQYPPYYGFSDEAVWLVSSGTTAIEAGFYSGYGANPSWTNGMLPYYTEDNGNNEHDGGGNFLTSNKAIWMAEITANGSGTSGAVQVDNWTQSLGSYTVVSPRTNYAQGEVDYKDIWMGGGSGESFTMYFQPKSGWPNSWAQWGSNSNTADSPFWYVHTSNSVWSNGGYGSSC